MTVLCTQVSQSDRATVGTQTRTVSGSGQAFCAVNYASHSDLNTAQNAARLTFGACDSALNQSMICSIVSTGESQDTGTQQHIAQTGRFGMRLNGNTGNTLPISETAVSALPNDGITLNVIDAASARVSNQLLMHGSGSSEFITIEENQTEGQFTDAVISAIPDAIIAFTNNDDMNSGGPHTGFFSHNVCYITVADSGSTINYAGQNHTFRRSGTTQSIAAVYNDGIRTVDPTETTLTTDGHFTLSFPNATTMRMTTQERTDDAAPAVIGFLLLYLDGHEVSVGIADTPTSTGVQSIPLNGSFIPQMVMFSTNLIETVSSSGSVVNGTTAGNCGVACVTRPPGLAAGNLERCTNSRSETGVSTTDTQNYTSSNFLEVIPHDGGTTDRITGAFDSFSSGSVSVNFSAVASTARKFPYIAISAAQAATGVVVDESTSNTNSNSLDPVITLNAPVTVQESVSNSNSNALDPNITLNAPVVVSEEVSNTNSNSLNPAITLSVPVVVSEAVSNTNSNSLNPNIILASEVVVNESVSNTNSNSLDPNISLTANVIVNESVSNTSSISNSPTISLGEAIVVNESVSNTNSSSLNPTITIASQVIIDETTSNTNSNSLNPTISVGEIVRIDNIDVSYRQNNITLSYRRN